MILGVSKWLGNRVNMKESHVRIAFVILFLFAGIGILAYLISWLFMILASKN
ncbi:PspC domain-containing protein [Puteibacter caeruleilacunae]|nr:PspC domain-containing protein [Puteibacter caeruleilacunae]